MNAEEPDQTLAANQTVSGNSHKLPEQAQVPIATMPRMISFTDLIYQWQPMGIRITIEVPSGGFVGDDQNFLFLIRNGPFIPDWTKEYYDTNPDFKAPPKGYGFPPQMAAGAKLRQYAFNNTRNVFLQTDWGSDNSGLSIVHYDFPPVLSKMSMAFRKWRGDMQYRIRVVSGFTTQGYIIVAPQKNIFSPIALYNEYKTGRAISPPDLSYRDAMLNSYGLSDLSMYRHMEVTMPYDYPAPYYDQYMWLSRRVSLGSLTTTGTAYEQTSVLIRNEPHGDNFLSVGLRGLITNASNALTNLQFELEYRAVEGFQFADPGLLPADLTKTRAKTLQGLPLDNPTSVKLMPSKDWNSDGLYKIDKKPETLPPDLVKLEGRRNSLTHQNYRLGRRDQ